LAGASIAAVSVSGQSYVVRTTVDELRGRVFTALESVIRVALLLSMILMAPLSDLFARLIEGLVETSRLAPGALSLSGPRLTLLMSALIVLGAAAYAFRTLEWRACDEGCESNADPAPGAPAPERAEEVSGA
jgi:hypothetical protein